MAKRRKSAVAAAPESSRVELETRIRQLEAINRDFRQSELRARLSRVARENERLRREAGKPLPSAVLVPREYPSVDDARARERAQVREACAVRLDTAIDRVAALRGKLASDPSDETIVSLARALAEEKDARIALDAAEAECRAQGSLTRAGMPSVGRRANEASKALAATEAELARARDASGATQEEYSAALRTSGVYVPRK